MFYNSGREQAKRPQDKNIVAPRESQILKNFTHAEINKLRQLREDYRSGSLNDWPADHHRRRVAERLYRLGKSKH